MTQETAEFEKLQPWRFAVSWGLPVVTVSLMIYACEELSFKLYPLALFIIGACFFRIAVLGHEGLHHLICANKSLNTFLGRYFCHFLVFTSHSRYKNIHSLHHRYTGLAQDPDAYLYREFPLPFRMWLRRILWDLLSLRMLVDFFSYFTDIADFLKIHLLRRPAPRLSYYRSDLLQFTLFWSFFCVLFSLTGTWKYFLLYWVAPAYLFLPIIQLSNGIQHGAYSGPIESRTLLAPWWILSWLLPVDLNYHYEHHLNPHVPHYRLKDYSRFLQNKKDPSQARNLYQARQAAKQLFT